MSRPVGMLVHPLSYDPAWREHLVQADDLLRRTQEQEGAWHYGLVVERGRSTYHPPHIRRIGRGSHLFVTTYGGDDSIEMIPMMESGFRGSIKLPMTKRWRERDQPDAEATIAHARRVFDAVLNAETVDDDLSGVETWATGLAAIVRSLGSDTVDIRLPSGILPLEVHDHDDRYLRLPSRVRRSIARACPRTIYVDADPPPGEEGGMACIEVGPFSRHYIVREGHHDLDIDPIGTMRAMAHVMDTARLRPEDIRP